MLSCSGNDESANLRSSQNSPFVPNLPVAEGDEGCHSDGEGSIQQHQDLSSLSK